MRDLVTKYRMSVQHVLKIASRRGKPFDPKIDSTTAFQDWVICASDLAGTPGTASLDSLSHDDLVIKKLTEEQAEWDAVKNQEFLLHKILAYPVLAPVKLELYQNYK
jgi:hypothetical protein